MSVLAVLMTSCLGRGAEFQLRFQLTIMAPVYFKLKYTGLTCRAYFEDLPNWSDLSAKVNGLHGLPLNNIAVTFTDIDDEEIAVSSDAELQEFYQFSYRDGDIKLNVLDLSLSRAGSSTPGEFTRALLQIFAHRCIGPILQDHPSDLQNASDWNCPRPKIIGKDSTNNCRYVAFLPPLTILCTFFDSVTPTPASSTI